MGYDILSFLIEYGDLFWGRSILTLVLTLTSLSICHHGNEVLEFLIDSLDPLPANIKVA